MADSVRTIKELNHMEVRTKAITKVVINSKCLNSNNGNSNTPDKDRCLNSNFLEVKEVKTKVVITSSVQHPLVVAVDSITKEWAIEANLKAACQLVAVEYLEAHPSVEVTQL